VLHTILTSWSGEDVHLGLVDVELLFEAKIILFPMIGGFSQLSPTKSGLTSSAHLVVGVSFTLPSELQGSIAHGIAKTIQLPAISLIGLGSLAPTPYGQIQIAIPIPKVIVGATYNLNCDVDQPKSHPAPEGDGGRTGMTLFVGKESTGNPLPIVLFNNLNTTESGFGALGTQPNKW